MVQSNYSRRATELVDEAAGASNLRLADLVDEVRATSGSSNFWVDEVSGKRILSISRGAFSRSNEHRLVEAAHELVHAQRYNAVLKARNGDFSSAHRAFFETTDELYAMDEIGTEWLAARRIQRYLGGLSPQQAAETRSYIRGWQGEFRGTFRNP